MNATEQKELHNTIKNAELRVLDYMENFLRQQLVTFPHLSRMIEPLTDVLRSLSDADEVLNHLNGTEPASDIQLQGIPSFYEMECAMKRLEQLNILISERDCLEHETSSLRSAITCATNSFSVAKNEFEAMKSTANGVSQ